MYFVTRGKLAEAIGICVDIDQIVEVHVIADDAADEVRKSSAEVQTER
jgi:hypothetical protein